jgi:molecular chaperone GrpE
LEGEILEGEIMDAEEPSDEQPEEGGEAPLDEVELDPVAALEAQLQQAEAQAAEYLDGWQRARAEFANYRRRQEQRRQQDVSQIAARVLGGFLPVLDDLERAFAVVPPEVEENPWIKGLSLVRQKLLASMEKEGVSEMGTQPGDPFDPNYHQAVLHGPCDDYTEGQIADVYQRGFMIGEQVLRPAMVHVSSGIPGGDEPECEAEELDEGLSTDPA